MADIRMANTIAMIIGAYMVCWAPLIVVFFTVAYTEDIMFFQANDLLRTYYIFAICFAHFNSGVNPFIYAFRLRNVREAMKKVLRVKTANESQLETETT